MKPILLEVIAPVQTDLFHCSHCELFFHEAGVGQQVHDELLGHYPQDVKQQSERLREWLTELVAGYGDELRIRVIDSQSMEGFVKSVRHWVRRYPTFIVGGRRTVAGWDRQALEEAVRSEMSSAG